MFVLPHNGLLRGGRIGPWEVVASLDSGNIPTGIAAGDVGLFLGTQSGWTTLVYSSNYIVVDQDEGGQASGTARAAVSYRVMDGSEVGATLFRPFVVLRPPRTPATLTDVGTWGPVPTDGRPSVAVRASAWTADGDDGGRADAGLFDGGPPDIVKRHDGILSVGGSPQWVYASYAMAFGVKFLEPDTTTTVTGDGGNASDRTILHLTV